MRNKLKITSIITFQILLIIASFLTIAVLESQTSLMGNTINVAGKNRLLASQFMGEVKSEYYVKQPDSNPEKKLKELEENIQFLKQGGMQDGIEIKGITDKRLDDWILVNEKFLALKTKYLEFKSGFHSNLSYVDLIPLEIEITEFISASDILAQELGTDVEKFANDFVILEISLLGINVAVHIALILVIINIYRIEFSTNLKLEKLAAIGELSSRLAHDMRNPLNNINMSMQLLKTKYKDISDEEKFDTIENSLERMTHQIKDVMDFVRTREPNLSLQKLNTILKESLDKVKIPKEIKITLPNEDVLILCDKEQIEIVFINMILNSTESIQGKGWIKIKAKESPKLTEIQISDSGSGIPEEYLDKIFDPLITLKERGTGLGLASCKNIINSHGGKISVQNNPTTFTISIPKNRK
ncbi:MAG: PAS domain-containing sensor histidine kinase [Candidatus Nitrosomaritimum yanchengensis]